MVRHEYGSGLPAKVTGEYRFGNTRGILSDMLAPLLTRRRLRSPARWQARLGQFARRSQREDARLRGRAEDNVVIVTHAPLRMGLVGGATYPTDHYSEHGGRVLNCAIKKYADRAGREDDSKQSWQLLEPEQRSTFTAEATVSA